MRLDQLKGYLINFLKLLSQINAVSFQDVKDGVEGRGAVVQRLTVDVVSDEGRVHVGPVDHLQHLDEKFFTITRVCVDPVDDELEDQLLGQRPGLLHQEQLGNKKNKAGYSLNNTKMVLQRDLNSKLFRY